MEIKDQLLSGLAIAALAVAVAQPLPAAPQAQSAPSGEIVSKPGTQPEVIREESLGQIAREIKKERAAQHTQPAKVYTNQNLPTGGSGLSVVGSPASSSERPAARGAARGEDYYRDKVSELQKRLDTDKRELSVLQQQINVNQLQYYPNPNTQLQQQYSRSDIQKGQQDIEAKQKQVEADQQALQNLEEQLRRDGGNAGWLREGGSAGSSGSAGASQAKAKIPPPTEAQKKSKDYWQGRFKEARAALKSAQEQEQLSENELDLLKRQASLDAAAPNAGDLQAQVETKQAEVERNRAAVEQAQQDLNDLQQMLQQSGAPAEWSQAQ